MKAYPWIWPAVGATPINQGLDSEMFDRVDYPYTETFVREAIQNSLDARRDPTEPVLIRFSFHEEKLGPRAKYLQEAIQFREMAGLPVLEGWHQGKIKWVTVEDSNTKGLLGDLSDRKGDFWGYWLNFGLSNKTGTGRGGRGIGRVTFLIASKLHTVLGLTRRSSDNALAGCGMCVLKADQYGEAFRSTHAYLAAQEQGSIYRLHDTADFYEGMEEAFKLAPYSQDAEATGLSLIIPYPHDELEENGILAAAVDHFGPAILNGTLVVEVGVDRLDQESIETVAPCVKHYIKSKPVADGVERYLKLIEKAQAGSSVDIDLPSAGARLSEHRDVPAAVKLRSELMSGENVVFNIRFPMAKNGTTTLVRVTAAAGVTPYAKGQIDRLFREGMSLPDVKTRRPSDIDLVLLVEDEPLAQYLNFCEGKAHLDLLESKEVRTKLADAGFDGLQVKRLVKSLPDSLREFLTEESSEPDTSVWEAYFSIADPLSEKKKMPKLRKDDPEPPSPPPPEPPPPANVSAVIVETLPDGFRLKSNPDYTKFPATVEATIAYADGSSKPSWSEFDFRPKDLQTTAGNCTPEFSENKLRVGDWSAESHVEVTGFDVRRELDTRIRTESNASQD